MRLPIICLATLLAGCVSTSRDALDSVIDTAAGDAVQVSVHAVDLRSGEVVFSRSPRLLMRPGSTMKLLTTCAVAASRPDLVVKTMVRARTNGIALIGGGDPMFASADLEALVDQLVAKGLEGTRGPIVCQDPLADEDSFGQGWMWDDEPEAFMPHVSGLTVDRGCVTVTVRAGEPDSIVSMTPASDHLEVRRSLDAGPVRIVRHPVRRPFTVHVSGTPSGAAPASRTISVPAPALHAGRVFKAILMRRGLATGDVRVVTSPLGEGGEILAVRERRLPELLARSNGPSDNLVTELLLRHLGTPDVARSRGRVGGPDAGLDKVRDHLTACGVDPAGYRLADGSGVSHYNLVSAHLLVALLRDLRGRPGPGWALLRESLPRAGRDGTLKGRFRDTPALGHVRAKTGTISGVSALAGVISAKAGENDAAVVFAILVQNFTGPARPWRVLQERIVLALMERAGLGG